MGIGHQLSFSQIHWEHRLRSGGSLRRRRLGRGQRPLSTKDSLHLVFKTHRTRMKAGGLRSTGKFKLVNSEINRWVKYFYVKIEQISVQNDHIHLLIRTKRRSQFQHFFRVVAGQIAQRFEKKGYLTESSVTGTPQRPQRKGTGLWKYRPFSRIVRGWTAFTVALDYIRLNELEVTGRIPYRKSRLRGVSNQEWELFWR